ncbi:MAG: hypothetical protein AB1568_10850 [Thermodesulfobacteriota bacterium]
MTRLSLRLSLIFLLAALTSGFCIPRLYELRGRHQFEVISQFGQLPSALVQTMSGEFKGVMADYLLLKTITYMGYKLIANEKLDTGEWQLVHLMLHRVTDLDPRFWDPYLLGEMTLPWDAGMIEEANELLLKAAANRPEDFRPPYFLGFNAFYFQKDAKKAAPYLRQAAELPGAPGFLKALASRFSLYSRETTAGIAFLEGMLRSPLDDALRRHLEKRLSALKTIDLLERKVEEYRRKFGSLPESVDILRQKGLIDAVPSDPYGGQFVVLPNGRVYTTSDLVSKTH